MSAAHHRLGVTDAAFSRVVEHLVGTLREFEVPETWIAEVGYLVEPLRASIVTRSGHGR